MNLTTHQLAEILIGVARSQQALIEAIEIVDGDISIDPMMRLIPEVGGDGFRHLELAIRQDLDRRGEALDTPGARSGRVQHNAADGHPQPAG